MFAPIPILLYHRVDPGGGDFVTRPDVLGQHLAWLADRGYRTLTAGELARVVSGEAPAPPRRSVAITFDDGYADLPREVAPLLREYAFTATAFLITGRCPARPGPDDEHLAWSDARSLATEGILEFHTHTHTHTRWELDPAQVGTVLDDVAASRATLASELGRPERTFDHLAWPWGRTCPEWEAGAARLGLTTQYVVQRGAVTRPDQPRRLPRILLDGAPLPVLTRWLGVLSSRAGATATNQLFGAVRQCRQGAGYR